MQYKKLGEIGTIITGTTPTTKDVKNYSSKDYCFFKPGDIDKDGISLLSKSEDYVSDYAFMRTRQLPKGAVLVTCIGIVGKVGILDVEATCNQQINAIIPNEDVDARYLAYTILSKRYYMEHIANAPVVPLINKTQFSQIPVPVPSLATQSRIVSELDLLTSLIDNQKKQLDELSKLQQSTFYSMFGDPVENEKEWPVKKLGEVCEIVAGQVSPLEEPYSSMYHVGPANMISGSNDLIDLKLAKAENLISGKYLFSKGMILYSKIRPNLNKVVVANIDGICSADMYPIICSDNIQSNYLLFILRSNHFLEYAINNSGRANIPKINRNDLFAFTLPLPPLPLQTAFAEKISAIEEMKKKLKASIAETQRLFDSRMQEIFG